MFSMWAPVSNRKPPPESAGSWRHVPVGQRRPVLPDDGVDVEDRPELAGAKQPGRLADLRGEAALERDDEQPAGPVAGLDQRLGLVGRHDHRLLEQDVEAGLEAGRRLGEVEGVRRDDEHRVELDRRSVATKRCQSGSFGGDRQAVAVEQLGGRGERAGRRLADGDDVGVGAVEHLRRGGSAPSTPAPMNPTRVGGCPGTVLLPATIVLRDGLHGHKVATAQPPYLTRSWHCVVGSIIGTPRAARPSRVAAQMDERLGRLDAGLATAECGDHLMVIAPDALAVLARVREERGLLRLDDRRDVDVGVRREPLRLLARVHLEEVELRTRLEPPTRRS